MDKEIVNRVANSSLITMDLTDYAPTNPITALDVKAHRHIADFIQIKLGWRF